MKSIIQCTQRYSFPVDRVTSLVVTGETEIDGQSPLHFGTAQRAGILAGNSRIGAYPAIFHRQKTIKRFTVRTFTDQRPLDTVPFNDMLAEAEEGRVAVAFDAAERLFSGIMGVKGRKAELLPPLEF